MPNQQLIDYIKQSTDHGQSRDQIKAALLGAGWQEGDIEMAFGAVAPVITPPSVTAGIPSSPVQSVGDTRTSTPQVTYGGFWIRFLALVLDSFIVSLIITLPIQIVVVIVNILSGSPDEQGIGLILFGIAMAILQIILVYTYYIALTYKKQATIGKKLLGLRVVSVDGSRLSLGKIVIRETIGKIVSLLILGIGYLMVAFTAKKQGLHDKFANSVVLSNPAERKTWAMVVAIFFAAVLPAVAILGIFASITLVSLNVAREKAADAAIKANLANIRASAEISYEMNGNYRNILSDTTVINSIKAAEATAGAKAITNVTDTAYAIYLPLKKPNPPATGWCVDSTGFSQLSVSPGTAASCSPGGQENRDGAMDSDIDKVKNILENSKARPWKI